MITFSSNFDEVIGDLVGKLDSINELNGPGRDKMLRAVASDTITQLHERIHVKGQKSDGTEFGEYSNAYLKRREANNLTGKKIILRFEGQLEKLTIVGTDNGQYSIGWLQQFNKDKADWMEERYGPIYDLTIKEKEHAKLVAEDVINQILEA